MITKFFAVGRAVFAEYDNGDQKLVAVTEFVREFSDPASVHDGYTYKQAIDNAEAIADCLNKTIGNYIHVSPERK